MAERDGQDGRDGGEDRESARRIPTPRSSSSSFGTTPGWRTPQPWEHSHARRGAQEERRRYEQLVGRPDALKSLASLYSTIVTKHRSPCFLNEMMLMTRLLSVSPTTALEMVVALASPTDALKPEEVQSEVQSKVLSKVQSTVQSTVHSELSTTNTTQPPLFTTGADCVLFSATVLDDFRHRLVHFGGRLCRRVMEHPSIHIFVPSLATYIQRALLEREDRLDEINPSGLNLFEALRGDSDTTKADSMVSSSGSFSSGASKSRIRTQARTNFSLTFHSDSDSRNHFRSQIEKTIYKNRQEVTDVFVMMVREYDRLKHELDRIPEEQFLSALPKRARKCVDMVRPDNLRWFVRLFVSLLLQSASSLSVKDSVSSSGDGTRSSEDMSAAASTKAAAAAARLRLLDRRMSKTSSNQGGRMKMRGVSDRLGVRGRSGNGNGHGNHDDTNSSMSSNNNKGKKSKCKKFKTNRRNSGGGNNLPQQKQQQKSKQSQRSQQKSKQRSQQRETAEMEMNVIPDVDNLFPEKAQRFFVLFLSHVESSMLHSLLRDTLASMLDKLSRYRVTTTTSTTTATQQTNNARDSPSSTSTIEPEISTSVPTNGSLLSGFTFWSDGSTAHTAYTSLTDIVLQARLIARVLGYLHFSTNWRTLHLSSSLPFQHEKAEALDVSNRLGPQFDVLSRLEESWRCGHLVFVVPWLVEYLKMTRHDSITRSTVSHQRTLRLLRKIRVRPIFGGRNSINGSIPSEDTSTSGSDDGQWNDTTQFLSIQIEQFFETLDESILDEAILKNKDEEGQVRGKRNDGEDKGKGGRKGETKEEINHIVARKKITIERLGVDVENLITERLMIACCDRYTDVLQSLIVDTSSSTTTHSSFLFGATPRGTSGSISGSLTPGSSSYVGGGIPSGGGRGNGSSVPGTPTSGYHQRYPSGQGRRRASSRKIRPITVTRASSDDSGMTVSLAATPTFTRSLSNVSLSSLSSLSEQQPVTSFGFSPSLFVSTSTTPTTTTASSTPSTTEADSPLPIFSTCTSASPPIPHTTLPAPIPPPIPPAPVSVPKPSRNNSRSDDLTQRLREELSKIFFDRNPQQRNLCDFALKALVTNARDHAIRTLAIPESRAFAQKSLGRKKGSRKERRKGGESQQHREMRVSRDRTTIQCINMAKKYCIQFLPRLVLTIAPVNMVSMVEDPNGGEMSLQPRQTPEGEVFRQSLPLMETILCSMVVRPVERAVKKEYVKSMEIIYGSSSMPSNSTSSTSPENAETRLRETTMQRPQQNQNDTVDTMDTKTKENFVQQTKFNTNNSMKNNTILVNTNSKKKRASKSVTKALNRLTPSGQLLSCYIVKGELRRKVCSIAMSIMAPFRELVAALKEDDSGDSSGSDGSSTSTLIVQYVDSKLNTLSLLLDRLCVALEQLRKEISLQCTTSNGGDSNGSENDDRSCTRNIQDVEVMRIVVRGCLCDGLKLIMQCGVDDDLRARVMTVVFDRCACVMVVARTISVDATSTIIGSIVESCCDRIASIKTFALFISATHQCIERSEIVACSEHLKAHWEEDAVQEKLLAIFVNFI